MSNEETLWPDFVKGNERFQRYFQGITELDLMVLRGHLLIEEALEDYILRQIPYPEHVFAANLRFPQKVEMVRALWPALADSNIWPLVDAINSLRNNLVHGLESPRLPARIEAVLAGAKARGMPLYRDHMSDEARRKPTRVVETFDVGVIVAFVIGFLQEWGAGFEAGLSSALDHETRNSPPSLDE